MWTVYTPSTDPDVQSIILRLHTTPPTSRLQAEQEQLKSVVGSLNWLACSTRIEIATITNMLEQHLQSATPFQVEAERYVANYIKGCKSLGITSTMQK